MQNLTELDLAMNIGRGVPIQVLDKGFVRVVDWMGDDTDIVKAARVSYLGGSKGEEEDKKLLFYLYRHQHMTPFEMCVVKFDIKMPIFVWRQYIRHRMQSLNEVSGRYTELKDDFYLPSTFRKQSKTNKQGSSAETFLPEEDKEIGTAVEGFCGENYELYKDLLFRGVAKEMARIVLPLNLYTQFFAKWDLRNLLHFIALRDDSHAQAEIQEYGKVFKQIVKSLYPWTYEAYERFKFVCVDTKTQEVVNKT